MKIVIATAMSIAALGMTWLGASPASAHTPAISADCSGVHVQATAYDAGQQNQWSVTIGGATQSGTFGASFDQTFPVPQDGAITSWSGAVAAQDGSYPGQGSGSVGPCGTPPPTDECVDLPGDQPAGTSCTPPPDVVRADSKSLDGCAVALMGTTYGAGALTYDEQYTDTYVFNGTTNTWDLVTDTSATIGNVAFTRWSAQEQVAHGCTQTPAQPPALHTSESTHQSVCGQDVVVTTTVETTTPYVYDAQTNDWVLGEPQEQTTTTESPVAAEECDETGVSPDVVEFGTSETVHVVRADVPVKAQVPTFVDSGLGGVTPAAATVVPSEDQQTPALALTLMGLMGTALVAGGLRLRRS